MKKLTLLLAVVLITAMSTMAQVAINTDDTDAHTSTILDVKSTTMGFLPPRMTQAEMDAIANPATGLMVYCTDCAPGSVRVFDGFNWVESNGYPAGLGENEIYNYKTGKIWMDRNLGATQVATSSTDALAYGDLYQWGRAADGHQVRSSSTHNGQATTAVPNDGNAWDGLFIIGTENWLATQDDNLWQGISGDNNPCPSGFRVPTEDEFNQEHLSWTSQDDIGAFASLKLTIGGKRLVDGSFGHVNSRGFCWSSTVSSNKARRLKFYTNYVDLGLDGQAEGFSVRCIKD